MADDVNKLPSLGVDRQIDVRKMFDLCLTFTGLVNVTHNGVVIFTFRFCFWILNDNIYFLILCEPWSMAYLLVRIKLCMGCIEWNDEKSQKHWQNIQPKSWNIYSKEKYDL